jgi:hypothetical protein
VPVKHRDVLVSTVGTHARRPEAAGTAAIDAADYTDTSREPHLVNQVVDRYRPNADTVDTRLPTVSTMTSSPAT